MTDNLLNPRQKKFAEHYAATGNAAEAARIAGYSETNARRQGQRLLSTNVHVRGLVDEIQRQAEVGRISSIAEIKEFWSKTMNDPDVKITDRLRASEHLAKAGGLFLHTRPDDGGSEEHVIYGECGGEDVLIYLPDNGRDRNLQHYEGGSDVD